MQMSRRDVAKAVIAASAVGPSASAASRPGAAAPQMLIEWQSEPWAIDGLRPRFQWSLRLSAGTRGLRQSAFRLTISDDERQTVLDTGRIASTETRFEPQSN